MSILKKLRERSEPLNVRQVAKLLGVSEATIQRWVRDRWVPAFRINGTIRFDAQMLADWIEQLLVKQGQVRASAGMENR